MSRRNARFCLITAPILAGVERLANTPLTINGITVAPTIQLVGSDPSASPWVCRASGTSMSEAGAGSSPTYSVQGPGLQDRSVRGELAKYLVAPNNSYGDLTTQHIVFEVVWKHYTTGFPRFIAKGTSASVSGWQMYGGASVTFRIDTVTSAAFNITSALLMDGAWYHGIVFCKRDGSGQWYVNGAASGSAVVLSDDQTTISVALPVAVLAASDGTQPTAGTVAYAALHARDGWLNSHLQPDIARERAALVFGASGLHNHAALAPTVL